MKEPILVSTHLLKVYQYSKTVEWFGNNEVAEAVGLTSRTARKHTRALYDLKILERIESFPGFKFKLSKKALENNPGFLGRLEQAILAFSKE